MSTRDNSQTRRTQRRGQLVYAREMAERQISGRPLSANPQMAPAYGGGFAAFRTASQPSFDKVPGSGMPAMITSESATFNVPIVNEPSAPPAPPAVRTPQALGGTAPPPKIDPLAPQITRIDASGEQLTIYFEPGRAPQNAKIDKYEISLNGGTSYGLYVGNVVLSPVGVRNSQNGAILVNGTEYSVRMRLISGDFIGEPSNLVKATPDVAPEAPSILTAVPTYTSGGISFGFSAGASNNGSPIRRYEYSLNNGSWVNMGIPDGLVHPISGLTNGASYTLRLRAVNTMAGAVATWTPAIKPDVKPGAPTITEILGEDKLLRVYFTLGQNLGSPITEYEYYLTNEDSSISSGFVPFTPGYIINTNILRLDIINTAGIVQLVNGNIYKIYIRVNNTTNGFDSNIMSGTPDIRAEAPTNPEITAGDGTLTVDFEPAVVTAGGTPVTSYVYSKEADINETIVYGTPTTIPNSTKLRMVITGLTNGIQQTIRIRGKNNIVGVALTVTGTPEKAPDAPLISMTGDNQQLIVTLDNDGSNSGSAIVDYYFKINAGQLDYTDWITAAARQTSAQGKKYFIITSIPRRDSNNNPYLDPIVNNTEYKVIVKAYNTMEGGSSNEVSAIPNIKPATPVIQQLIEEDTTADPVTGLYTGNELAFVFAHDRSNGAIVTKYEYLANALSGETANTAQWTAFTPEDASNSGAGFKKGIATNLIDGIKYTLKLRVGNTVYSDESAQNPEGTPDVAPPMPYIVSETGYIGTDRKAKIDITFTLLGINYGSPIQQYQYRISNNIVDTPNNGPMPIWDNNPSWYDAESTNPYTVTKYNNITDLVAGTRYYIVMRTKNTKYETIGTTSAGDVTPDTTPAAPTFTLTGGNNQITVSFTDADTNGGSAIKSYAYSVNNATFIVLTAAEVLAKSFTISSNIANGTTYAIRLKAINNTDKETVAPLTLKSITPNAEPLAPSNIHGIGDDGRIYIYFSDIDYTNGGTNIIGYQYSLDDGMNWTDIISAVANSRITLIIQNLQNGTQYKIIVRAKNTTRTGLTSSPITSTPDRAPAAPTITSITPLSNIDGFTVNYTAPLANGGSPIVHYKYEYSINDGTTWSNGVYANLLNGGTATDTSGSFNIANLIAGNIYTIRLSAVNNRDGAQYTYAPVTLDIPPSAPASITIALSEQTVTVTIGTATANGTAIQKYEYAISTNGTYGGWADVTNMTFTLVGEAGKTYAAKARAKNNLYGPELVTTNSVVVDVVPSPPTNLSLSSVGDKSVTIAFTSAISAGTPIAKYSYSTNSGTNWVDINSTSSPITITKQTTPGTPDLVNGTTYTILLRAHNATFVSVEPHASIEATPDVIPTKPSALTVSSVGDKSVTIAFTPATSTGTPIAKYSYSTNSGSNWVDINSISSSITITKQTTSGTPDLVNGTKYTVLLRAHNATFVSVEPHAYIEATPDVGPGAPTINLITPVPPDVTFLNTFKVDYIGPSVNNGSAITKYQYSYSSNGTTFSTPTDATILTGGNLLAGSFNITGLTAGTEYYIKLHAVNTIPGTETTSAKTLLEIAPVVNSVGISTSGLNVTINITSFGTMGSGIKRYEYSYSTNDGTSWSVWMQGTAALSTSYTFTGIVGTTYSGRARAVNNLESEAKVASVTVTPDVPPAAITALTLVVTGDKSITITFTEGTPATGTAITNYKYSTDNGSTWALRTDGGGNSTTMTITRRSSNGAPNLVNGIGYLIRVKAVNAAGDSVQGDSYVVAIPDVAPIISGLSFAASSTAVTITVNITNTGSTIQEYQYSLDNSTWSTCSSGYPAPSSFTITNSAFNYIDETLVYVRAYNSTKYSNTYDVRVLLINYKPQPPTITAVNSGSGYLDVYFSQTINPQGGAPMRTYGFQIKGPTGDWSEIAERNDVNDGGGLILESTVNPIRISSYNDSNYNYVSSLTNGQTYTVRIYATNGILSDSSNEMSGTSDVVPLAPVYNSVMFGLDPTDWALQNSLNWPNGEQPVRELKFNIKQPTPLPNTSGGTAIVKYQFQWRWRYDNYSYWRDWSNWIDLTIPSGTNITTNFDMVSRANSVFTSWRTKREYMFNIRAVNSTTGIIIAPPQVSIPYLNGVAGTQGVYYGPDSAPGDM